MRSRAATGSRAVLVLQLAAFAAVLAAHLLGVRAVPVLSGSMTPWAPTGSLVLTVPVAGADVVPGDVVAFRPPAPYEVAGGRPILHRVDTVDVVDGVPTMTTRGDANPGADPWRVDLVGAQLGRAVAVLPVAGRLLAGGPGPALAVLAGGAVALAGVRTLRAPGRTGRHRATACPDCTAAPA